MTPAHARLWSIGPLRRFTRNLVLPVDLAGRRLLLKCTRDPVEAHEEIRGHRRVSDHYRVPALHAHLRIPGANLLLYERLPITRDAGLLLDLLNSEQPAPALIRYLDELTDHYHDVMVTTARQASPTDVVRKLYWERAAPGGRLDQYYANKDFTLTDGDTNLPISRLADHALCVNDRDLHLDWKATLSFLHDHFRAPEPVWAALTQGDPTDVNLAHPLAWLDLDTGGLNSIVGEFANYLWYISALGGWLVPRYNPAAFVDHPATFTHLTANAPALHHTRIDSTRRRITLNYAPRLAPPRRLAAAVYWHKLVRPVTRVLGLEQNLGDLLRPYLAMRVLAVYDLATLQPADQLLLIARLAEVMSPDFCPEHFFLITEAPCTAP